MASSFPSSDVRQRRVPQAAPSKPAHSRVAELIKKTHVINPTAEAAKVGLYKCEFLDAREQIVPKLRAIISTAENYQREGKL